MIIRRLAIGTKASSRVELTSWDSLLIVEEIPHMSTAARKTLTRSYEPGHLLEGFKTSPRTFKSEYWVNIARGTKICGRFDLS
jgi:hypothetical protein